MKPERLTWKSGIDGHEDVSLRKGVTVGDAVCQLADYEDTGLTPGEVMKMKRAWKSPRKKHIDCLEENFCVEDETGRTDAKIVEKINEIIKLLNEKEGKDHEQP